jgi:quinolinate synthase
MAILSERELKERIRELSDELNAVILAHNYQLAEAQDIADFTGDSLELSIKASKTSADVILFCGVRFMAETAYILSPEKTVLLPRLESGCPMADMADADELRAMKRRHPDALVVTYVNSSAEVKAESDICVTSANAVKIVAGLPGGRPIIFVPDRNLGAHVRRETGRDDIILWPGYCPTHMRITADALKDRQNEFPDAEVLVHPESSLDVIDLADAVLSTGGMLRHVAASKAGEFIVATEMGLIYRLSKENPGKRFVPVSEQAVCPMMKMHRLEDILSALEKRRHVIEIPEEIRIKAKNPIERMIEAS